MENETLEKLREMLTVRGDRFERKCLWNVLTALRGPDLEDVGKLNMRAVKHATTGVIRWHVLGPNAGRFVNDDEAGVQHEKYGCLYGPDSAAHLEVRKSLAGKSNLFHFFRHARDAFEALGLKWDAVNE